MVDPLKTHLWLFVVIRGYSWLNFAAKKIPVLWGPSVLGTSAVQQIGGRAFSWTVDRHVDRPSIGRQCRLGRHKLVDGRPTCRPTVHENDIHGGCFSLCPYKSYCTLCTLHVLFHCMTLSETQQHKGLLSEPCAEAPDAPPRLAPMHPSPLQPPPPPRGRGLACRHMRRGGGALRAGVLGAIRAPPKILKSPLGVQYIDGWRSGCNCSPTQNIKNSFGSAVH